jgi:hypothetical protein
VICFPSRRILVLKLLQLLWCRDLPNTQHFHLCHYRKKLQKVADVSTALVSVSKTLRRIPRLGIEEKLNTENSQPGLAYLESMLLETRSTSFFSHFLHPYNI